MLHEFLPGNCTLVAISSSLVQTQLRSVGCAALKTLLATAKSAKCLVEAGILQESVNESMSLRSCSCRCLGGCSKTLSAFAPGYLVQVPPLTTPCPIGQFLKERDKLFHVKSTTSNRTWEGQKQTKSVSHQEVAGEFLTLRDPFHFGSC